MKKVFVANDGKSFNNEQECFAYEKKLNQKTDEEAISKKAMKDYEAICSKHDKEIAELERRHEREEREMLNRQNKEFEEFCKKLAEIDKKYPGANVTEIIKIRVIDKFLDTIL